MYSEDLIQLSRKRRIATEAALQFSARTGCKILWVEGRSFECFIRDYRAAYTAVTGEHLPHGLTLGHTLLKMRATLESCRNEWLMVIFDLQYYLEEDIQTGLNYSNLFLPEWSRILVTSSDIKSKPGGSLDQDEAMTCCLKFARRATCLHVTTLEEERTKQYMKAAGVNPQDVDFPAFRHLTSSSIPPLRLALSCASLRLLNISASRFHLLCLQKAKEGTSPVWTGYTPVFADTMSILWEALNDYNTAAVRLLAICEVVDRRDIPICLVRQFPEFRNQEHRFDSAMNVLRLSGLIEVHQKYGTPTINLHLLPYRWVQFKLRRVQDNDEYRDLVHSWISILNKYLVKPGTEFSKEDATFDPGKFWPIFAHIAVLCNLKPAHIRQLRSFGYMLFLKNVGLLLAEDGLLPSLAGITISHALKMCGYLRSRCRDEQQLDRHYVHIRQIRAMAFLKVSEYRQGEIELWEAQNILNIRLAEDAESKHKSRQIQDAVAHLSICQGNGAQAIRVLEDVLEHPEPNADPAKLAQRHYWMATCKGALEEDLVSLEHSHMAMRHWLELSHEERWGYKDSRRLHWVEKHMLNLIGFSKFKGAILLGRQLLERARDLTPVLGQSVSRLTYRVVFCLCALDKVDEAEAAVVDLLEMPAPEKDMDEVTKSYLLHTLHELAVTMQRVGRTVEAEGLFRLNIRYATMYDIKTLSGNEKYDTWRDFVQLVMCLIEQGKVHEARESTEDYQSEDADPEFLQTTIRNTITAYDFIKDLYARAIEAEKAGTTPEFRAALDVDGYRASLKRAIQLFGSVKRRVRSGRDFESDIDLHHISRARKSRLLHLLEFRLVYLSWVATKDASLDPNMNEYLWANRRQSVLGQYWKVCECRRHSHRELELHHFVDPKFDPPAQQHKLKQKLITDWITRTPAEKPRPPGCTPTCPCISANTLGPKETASWESKLLIWTDDQSTSKHKRKPSHPYRVRRPPKAPVSEDELFQLVRPNTWWWVQSEFASGEVDGENYILRNATNIPAITVTPPDGQVYFLPMAKETQGKLGRWFERDYAKDWWRMLERERGGDGGDVTREGKAKMHVASRLDDILEDEEEDEGERDVERDVESEYTQV
ncbi:hypothetical protein H2200_007333 [Cladophialophora chaetospira]|uniref:Uncharacterized protein n=1 Tax=Cladophialophora chaetospira TaxID=386627 RepID=A0AA38X7L5_9EURO|nr:hypothetical protein H2200_007333 [Cladophialophora chaetospira]